MNKLDIKYGRFDQNLMDMFDKVNTAVKYQSFSVGGVVIGTGSAAKVKVTNSVTFIYNGTPYTKATNEVAFTATTHDIPASATTVQEAMYAVCYNDATASAPVLVMGDIATGSGKAVMPSAEKLAGMVVVGAVRVAIAAGATPFDASTDLLSAGHITDTYYDIAGPVYPRFDAVV
jgi:hypothetical protein